MRFIESGRRARAYPNFSMTDSKFMKNIRRGWLHVVVIALITLFLLLPLTVDDQLTTIEKKNSSSGKKFH
jgi:hypothetical protein